MAVSGIEPRQSSGQPVDDSLPHDDLGPRLNLVFWLLTGLAFGFLGLRIYCKVIRRRRLWWDDYVLIASWVSLAVSAAATTVCVELDYGKHLYDMRPQNLPKMPFVATFAGFFSVLAATWSKTSFAMTLLRLSEGWMRVVTWIIILTLNAVMGTAMLFFWIKCRPFAKVWDGSLEGWCVPQWKIIILYQFSAGYSGSIDVILALFPWLIIWKMKMTKREKFGVAIAMSMGVLAGATSFVKMAMLPHLAGDPVDTVAVTIWGGAEGAITIIAASIPVLRAFIRNNKNHSPAQFGTADERQLNATKSSHSPEISSASPRIESEGSLSLAYSHKQT